MRKKQPNVLQRHWRTLVPAVILCIVAGGTAVAMLQVFVRGYEMQLELAAGDTQTVNVVVAKVELRPGHEVVADDLDWLELPPRFVPATAALSAADVIGRTVDERVIAGDILREERLSEPGSQGGLEALVPMGMRALSINLSSEQAVSGFLEEGVRVDLLVTLSADRTNGVPAVTTVAASNVRVVAVDDRHELSKRRGVKLKPQVTILVSADDAQRITQALEKGRVLATLRSDLDLAHRDSEGTTTSMTLGHREEQRAIRFDQSYGAPVLQPLEVIAGAERRTEWH